MTLQRTVVLLAPAAILGLFSSSLIGIDRLSFRDVSHFYTPLYDYVDARMSEQWLPLWNPLDHTGMPLLGETTTAVFYPPRIAIYALPLSSEVTIAFYVVFHLVLASLTAFIAARWNSATRLGASVASIVYPLSGTVLFLYCNPPFLCGAAWLPLVLGVFVSAPRMSSGNKTLIAASSLAMMILAGDPQAALHAMCLAAVVWGGRRVFAHSTVTPFWVLVTAPALAAILAAPQIAASVAWSSQSDRVAIEPTGHWYDPPLVGSKRYHSFQYSLPPWHVLELATPNAYGSLLPEHRRLSRRLPGDGRMWTPTLYMSVVVMLALVSRLVRIRSGGIDAWMVIALLSVWLALGHFGLVWLVQTNTPWLSSLDSAIGGPYWLLYQFLPGYDSFRYPAKWLVFVAFGLAMVTSEWADRFAESPWKERRIVVSVGSFLTVAMLLAVYTRFDSRWLIDPHITTPTDVFWGPLQVGAGMLEIARSWVHSWLVCWLLAAMMWIASRRKVSPSIVGYALLLLVAFDLSIAAKSLIYRSPIDRESALVHQLGRPGGDTESDLSKRWMRTQSDGGWPEAWRERSSEDRLLEVEASGRVAWFGRWHLADRTAVFNSMVSIRSRRVDLFWRAARQVTSTMSTEESDTFWKSMRRWLAISNVLHLSDASYEPLQKGVPSLDVIDRHVTTTTTPPPLSVHWKWTQAADQNPNAAQVADRLREIWQSGEYVPQIDSGDDLSIRAVESAGRSSVEVIRQSPELAEFQVTLSQPALLTRATLQDGNWSATYRGIDDPTWQSAKVHRVDGLIQAIQLPPGEWNVQFQYLPWWLMPALIIAAIAWTAVMGLVVSVTCGLRD